MVTDGGTMRTPGVVLARLTTKDWSVGPLRVTVTLATGPASVRAVRLGGIERPRGIFTEAAEEAKLLVSSSSNTWAAESVWTTSQRWPAADAGIVTTALRPVDWLAGRVSLNVTVARRSPVVAVADVARNTRSENG